MKTSPTVARRYTNLNVQFFSQTKWNDVFRITAFLIRGIRRSGHLSFRGFVFRGICLSGVSSFRELFGGLIIRGDGFGGMIGNRKNPYGISCRIFLYKFLFSKTHMKIKPSRILCTTFISRFPFKNPGGKMSNFFFK